MEFSTQDAAEQRARDMLQGMGVEGVEHWHSSSLAELTSLIRENEALKWWVEREKLLKLEKINEWAAQVAGSHP